MLNNIKLKLKEKAGIGAIWCVVVLACLIPLFLFGFVDVPYYMRLNRKIKNTVDDISASAVTYLNENALREGIALLDATQAEKYVMNELKIWYGVDCTGATNIPVTGTTSIVRKCKKTGESILPDDPYIIKVNDNVGITDPIILEAPHIEYVIHKGILQGNKYVKKDYKLAESKTILELKYPSVVVTVSAKVKGLLFGYPVYFMKTGYSQTGVSGESSTTGSDGTGTDNGTSIDLANALASVNAIVKNGYAMGFMKPNSTNQYTITEILTILQKSLDISFKGSNGATLGGGNLRTGATMKVKDNSNGKTVEYPIVVFGDVNGDGMISSSDIQAIKNYLNGSDLPDAFKVGADCNHDGKIDLDDVKAIENHINNIVKIEQSY